MGISDKLWLTSTRRASTIGISTSRPITRVRPFWRLRAMSIPAASGNLQPRLRRAATPADALRPVRRDFLRPLDLMQPYRLKWAFASETHAAKISTSSGDEITNTLNAALEAQGDDVVINLASDEYFRSVKPEGACRPHY